MARERQFQGFVISDAELAEALKLPADHRIVRISEREPHHPPGVIVVVEGPGCVLCPPGSAIYHHHNYAGWRDQQADLISQEAIATLGPYEWFAEPPKT